MNGTLSFVHAGTKEELAEKVKKEFEFPRLKFVMFFNNV